MNAITLKKKMMMKNEQGFTLVEVIAVLIILGILAAVAVPKYIGLEENAKERAVDAAISELNGRESMYWAKLKISPTGAIPYTSATLEIDVWKEMSTPDAAGNLGTDLNVVGGTPNYVWTVAPTNNGGTLTFQGSKPFPLTRIISTIERPGAWKR